MAGLLRIRRNLMARSTLFLFNMPAAFAFLLCAGCGHMPVTSMVKLARIDFKGAHTTLLGELDASGPVRLADSSKAERGYDCNGMLGEAIVRILERLPNHAEEMSVAVGRDGPAGARIFLKKLVFDLRTEIAAAMKILADSPLSRPGVPANSHCA